MNLNKLWKELRSRFFIVHVFLIGFFLSLYMNCSPVPKDSADKNQSQNFSDNSSNGGADTGQNPPHSPPPALEPPPSSGSGNTLYPPEAGVCGLAVNSCSVGSLFDIPDTSTDYNWICKGVHGGSDQLCSAKIDDSTVFKCIDNELQMGTIFRGEKKWNIIAYYGLFFGRLPEKAGYDYWLSDANFPEPFYTNWDNIVVDYYGTSYSNLKSRPTVSNASNWLANIYKSNWGTQIDPGGSDYWSPVLYEYAKNNSSPAGFLMTIYDSFLQTRCESDVWDIETKKTITKRQLTARNALLAGDHMRRKILKSYDIKYGSADYQKFEYFYRQTVQQTIAAINSSNPEDSQAWLEASNTVLNKFKSEIDTWVSQLNSK